MYICGWKAAMEQSPEKWNSFLTRIYGWLVTLDLGWFIIIQPARWRLSRHIICAQSFQKKKEIGLFSLQLLQHSKTNFFKSIQKFLFCRFCIIDGSLRTQKLRQKDGCCMCINVYRNCCFFFSTDSLKSKGVGTKPWTL